MLNEIVKDMRERIGAQPDSRCASGDEVRICWLICELESAKKRIKELENKLEFQCDECEYRG